MKLKHICTEPQFAAAKAEYEAMGAALGKVNSRIAEIEALFRSYAPDPDEAHVKAALEFAETGKVRATQHISVLQDEHVALRAMREKVTASMSARAMALHSIGGELSVHLCRAQAAAHKKLAARMAAALREVQLVFEEENAFIREIEKAGYSPRFSDYVAWPLLEGTPINTKLRELDRYAAI